MRGDCEAPASSDFLHSPYENNKPENPFQTMTSQFIRRICIKYLKTNNFPLNFFQYSHKKYKNRNPDRKPDPGPTRNF